METLAGLPRLSEHESQLTNLKYKEMELLPGYLVVHQEKGKVAWEARELPECRASAENFRRDLVQSLNERSSRCIHEACTTLEKCLDLHGIFSKICGERSKTKCPYDKVKLHVHGISSFKEFVDYVSNLPHVRESGFLNINSVLSVSLFDKLKETLVSAV